MDAALPPVRGEFQTVADFAINAVIVCTTLLFLVVIVDGAIRS